MKIGTLLCAGWIATVVTSAGAARPVATGLRAGRQSRSTTPDQLPIGEGRDAFLAMCSDCHDLDTAIGRRRQPKDWHDLVELMRQRGANGEDADAAAVVKYLTRHFGKVDVNRAPAADLMLVLNVDQAAADQDHRCPAVRVGRRGGRAPRRRHQGPA